MESLITGMLSKMGDGGIEKIAQSAGIDSTTAKNILSQAGPLLTAKMADNAKKPEGLGSLDAALADHDGSVFDHIDDVADPQVDTKGEKILGHIFGDKTADLVGALSAKNNADSGSTSKLLAMAAPLVLGQLGSQKKSSGMDASGIFELLQGEKKQASGNNMLMGLAEKFLDKDGDGSVVDDLMGMAGNMFKK